jgi:glucose dehydrogenase
MPGEMRRSRIALSLVLALVGLVWLGQGVGIIGGSAMSGSSFWAIAGVVLVALAAVIVLREARAAAK